MVALVSVNFSSGFNNFVNETENQNFTDSKSRLIEHYRQHKSWDILNNDISIWRAIVGEGPRQVAQQKDQKVQKKSPLHDSTPNSAPASLPLKPKEKKPLNFLKTGRRISLYDKNKSVIVGRIDINENPRIETILLNGKTIGWLALVPSGMVKDSPASAFLTKQIHNYYLIAIAIIFIAFAMALLLSKHLSSPIKRLICGTTQLIRGEYKQQIDKVTNDELGILSDNFNALAQTLEQGKEKRFQWMSDTSHELRTPLTVLRSHLIAIQDGIFEADEKRVELFIGQIDNLSRIVDDLHQLSSSDIEAVKYKNKNVKPIDILSKTIDNFKEKFEGQSLNVDALSLNACDPCTMLGDSDRLQQLFTNLLENTCRYTKNQGNVLIRARIIHTQLEIIIEDSAPGVTKEDHAKLFERFFRVEKSRNRHHGGSGLGLSLCKKIVEAHKGTIISTDSQLGGVAMKVLFPIS